MQEENQAQSPPVAEPPVEPRVEQLAPTPEDEFYVDWALETFKRNLSFTNDVLQRLVTLNAALLGGAIAFYDEKILPPPLKPFVILSFFVSLVLAFLGMMPHEERLDIQCPSEVKAFKQRALTSKRRFLWGAGAAIAIAFGICFMAILCRAL